MVAPSAGPSRGTTPTPTPTHASGGNDVASSSSTSLLRTGAGQPVQQQASKLNPHSASFSYLQQQQQQSMSPYATFSPPPPMPPPQNRNGMYGAPPPPGPSGYSPYPISSANTGGMGMQPGPSGGNGNGNGSWHMAPPPPRGGTAPGQQQYQAMLHHAQQQQQHQHQHQQMAYYPSHSGMVPPSQNRIPPPAGAHPPPSAAAAGANGILLPLSSNPPPLPHHITAPMAAAGFGGMPMSPPPPPPPPQSAGPLHHHQLAAGPQQHLAHSQHIPHHQQHQPLLPPFSPQMRSLPPSTVAGPRLMPAPSLPVSPATPLPPQTVSPAPTHPSPAPPLGRSGSEAVAAAGAGGLGDGPRRAFGDATSPPPADLTSSSTNNAVPSQQAHAGPTRSHGHGIRRRKDHLPAPRDAEALTFATHLKIPREYQGMFGTPPSSSIASPGGSSASGAAATAGSRSRRSAAGTTSPSPSRSRSKAASSTSAVQAVTAPVASTSSAPIPAPVPAAAPPAEPATPVSRPAEAVVEPSAPSASQPSEEPPVPSTPKTAAPLSPESTSAPSLPPTSPRTPAAAVKRSWADLVRPPAGSQPKGVNGVMPISATVGGADLSSASSSAPRAADTLLSLLTRAPSHEHSPHAPTPRGLINNGNLCFANSTLQALVYCGSFWNLMSTVERSTKKNLREAMGPAATSGGHAGAPADKTASERSAVEATIAFLAEFRTDEAPAAAFDPILNRKSASASASASGTTTPKPPYNNNNHHLPSSPSVSTPSQPGPLSPTPIHDALRHNPRFDAMRRGTQEDAEEFLGFFLETLHEEILKLVEAEEEQEAKRKGKGKAVAAAGDEGWEEVGSKGRVATTRTTATKESPITCIFGGKLRSVLRCPGQKDSVTIEPFQRLQLDIQPDHVLSIEDALVQLTTPESLPDFMTSRGVRTQDASKQVFVDALPPVLLLHLKRFLYDEVGGVQKSTKKVAYGTELTIDERIMSAPLRAQVGRDGAKYELFGVVYHHGLQASGGHYTVAVRRGYHSPAWLELDDTHMRSLTADEVAVSSAAPTARRWESVADSLRRFEDEDGDQKNAYLLLYAKSS